MTPYYPHAQEASSRFIDSNHDHKPREIMHSICPFLTRDILMSKYDWIRRHFVGRIKLLRHGYCTPYRGAARGMQTRKCTRKRFIVIWSKHSCLFNYLIEILLTCIALIPQVPTSADPCPNMHPILVCAMPPSAHTRLPFSSLVSLPSFLRLRSNPLLPRAFAISRIYGFQ